MTKPDPKYSAGARAERAAFRAYLRRTLTKSEDIRGEMETLDAILQWVLARQQRYDRRPGGLGRSR